MLPVRTQAGTHCECRVCGYATRACESLQAAVYVFWTWDRQVLREAWVDIFGTQPEDVSFHEYVLYWRTRRQPHTERWYKTTRHGKATVARRRQAA